MRRVAYLAVVVAAMALASGPQADVLPVEPPTLTQTPGALTNSTDATFEFSTSDPSMTFACQLDGPHWVGCESPEYYPGPLLEGTHSFQVRAIDATLDTSQPVSFDWVVDLTPPRLPEDVTVEATSAAGAGVEFEAKDDIDPHPSLDCTPPSESTFPLGETLVDCTTATDAAGNASGPGSFIVTVQDTSEPVLSSRADEVVGQDTAGGAFVDYSLPSATDLVDPSPQVECAPAPGSFFPLGQTTVTCTAADSSGNSSAPIDFRVIVQAGAVPADPLLTAHVRHLTNKTRASFDFSSPDAATLQCRLTGPGHSGFAPCQTPTSQSYASLVQGSYLFTVQATNSIGNISQSSYAWTIDLTKPSAVRLLHARPGNARVRLAWAKPADADYKQVQVQRRRIHGHWKRVARLGRRTTYTDRDVGNDVRYRYRIRAVDRAGNISTGPGLNARPSKILRPQFAAQVGSSALIDWASVRRATYYNIQLWRHGQKVLSRWPLRSKFRLSTSWKYAGKTFSLGRDRYRVYVWPGFGSKAAATYGRLVGWSVFRGG